MTLPKMLDYAQSPSNHGWLNTGVHKDGLAIDIGWRQDKNNFNQEAHSLTDAKVLYVGYFADGGNLLVAGSSYDDVWDMWWSVQHLLKLPTFKVGDLLKQGQVFGNMGNTGQSKGEHFHVRVSFVKKGTPFSWGTFNASRYKPIDYVFAYPHQNVTDLRKKPIKPFIDPVSGEVKQDGYLVITAKEGSNVRSKPSLKANVVSVLPVGSKYNYIAYVDAEGYRWVTNGSTFVAHRKLDDSVKFSTAHLKNESIKPKETYINISPKSDKYAIYKTDLPIEKMRRPNNFADLRPKNIGGMSYVAKKVANTKNVYEITTRDFGKVHIAQVDGLSTITDSAVYKVF